MKTNFKVSKSFNVGMSFVTAAVMLVMLSYSGAAWAKKAEEKKAEAPKAATALIDINSATEKELESIKGIGAATAKKIVAKRPYKSVDELSKAGLSAKAIEAVKPFVTVGKAQVSQATDAAGKAATKAAAPVVADVAKTGKDLNATAKSAQADAAKAGQDVKLTADSTKAAAAKLAPGTKININTADLSTLEKLPDIGPVKAKAIIEGRPYNKIEDITKVKGIKGKTFDAVKDYIVVK